MANEDTCVGIRYDLSNDTRSAYLWSYNPTETAFVTIFLPIFAIIGIVGNCAFVFAVIRVPSLRSKSVNYYLVALAITDLIVLVSMLVFFLWPYSSAVSYHAPFSCFAISFVIGATLMISALLVTVVAIERYFAVVRPLQYRTLKKRNNLLIVLAVCMVGIFNGAVIVGPIYGKNTPYCITWPDLERYQNYPTSVELCGSHYYPLNGNILLVAIQDLPIFIALILNFILYWKIVRKLHMRKGITSTENTNAVRDQVARMLVINGSVFFLCQVPPRAFNFGELINTEQKGMWFTPEGYETVILILRLVFMLNSAINPYIYSMASSHYRRAIRDAFRRQVPSHGEESSSDQTPATKSSGIDQSIDSQI